MSITTTFRRPAPAPTQGPGTGEWMPKHRKRSMTKRRLAWIVVAAVSVAGGGVRYTIDALNYIRTHGHPDVAPGSVHGPDHTDDTTLLLGPESQGNPEAQQNALQQQAELETQFEAWGSSVLEAYQAPSPDGGTPADRVDITWGDGNQTVTLTHHMSSGGSDGTAGDTMSATFGVTFRGEINPYDMRSASYRHATGVNQFEQIDIAVDDDGVYSSVHTAIEDGMVVTVRGTEELPAAMEELWDLHKIAP